MSTGGADLAMLARYNAWADERLYASLTGLPASSLAASTPIFAGSILRTLNHVLLIGVVWRAHLSGVPHGFTTRNPETAPAFATLRDSQRQLDVWYVDYAGTLDATRRDERIPFTFIDGGDGAMTRGEIVMHVVNHASYHRGHITAMLYAQGVQPPATDLPVYLREQAPQSSNSACCAS